MSPPERHTPTTFLREVPGGIRLTIRVQPGARRSELTGIAGDALRIRIAAPPRDGAANRELLRFLSERFSLPKSRLTLMAGGSSRTKVVSLAGITRSQIEGRLGGDPPS